MIHTPIAPLTFQHPVDDRLGIEVISIAQLRKRATLAALSRLVRADFYRLLVVTQGHTQPWIDFEQVHTYARDALLVKPGQVFRHDFSQAWDGWMVVFRPERLYISEQSTGMPVDQLQDHHTLSPRAWAALRTARNNMQRDNDNVSDIPTRQNLLQLQLNYVLIQLGLAHTAALDLAPQAQRAQAHHQRFQKQLDKDFARHHQVQHFSNVLGLSVKNLNRTCLKATGQSTKSCINQRIALEAKRLLAHTPMAIQVIALDLGFEEPTNFVKFFKREVGMTPGQFRRSQTSPH